MLTAFHSRPSKSCGIAFAAHAPDSSRSRDASSARILDRVVWEDGCRRPEIGEAGLHRGQALLQQRAGVPAVDVGEAFHRARLAEEDHFIAAHTEDLAAGFL